LTPRLFVLCSRCTLFMIAFQLRKDNLSGIGTLNEKHLHSSLKEWCSLPGDRFEIPVEGYVVDIVRGDLLLEIQTGSFSAIRFKLRKLLRNHSIRLFYPVPLEKWIIKLHEEEDREPTRRRSPKRGRVEDLFRELVSIPGLMCNPEFSLEVLLTREEEIRVYDGKRGWRRRGWVITERRLLEVVRSRVLETPADWLELLPKTLDDVFTTADLAKEMGTRRDLAQKMAYCYKKAGLLVQKGKRGRSNLYSISE